MAVQLIEKDTYPSRLTYKVKGVAIDITGYTFTIKIGYTPTPLVKQAVNLNQTTDRGGFEFRWVATDLIKGNYPVEILTRFPDGTEKTEKLDLLKILPRIS